MLEPDLIELLESDAVIVIGTVDEAGIPEAGRGWGLRVCPGPDLRVRVLVAAEAARTHANLAATGRLAVTVTDVYTLSSAQVKGRVVSTEDLTDAEATEFERYFTSLAERISEVDRTPVEIVRHMRPGPLVAVVSTIEEVYDQTPGPVAGARLAPAEAS